MIYLCKMIGMPFVKVGYSENPEDRYTILNGTSPFEIVCLAERNGSRALEAAIHGVCVEFLVKNEWYLDCDFVRRAFARVFDPYPEAGTATELYKIKKRERMERRIAFGCESRTKVKNAEWYLKRERL